MCSSRPRPRTGSGRFLQKWSQNFPAFAALAVLRVAFACLRNSCGVTCHTARAPYVPWSFAARSTTHCTRYHGIGGCWHSTCNLPHPVNERFFFGNLGEPKNHKRTWKVLFWCAVPVPGNPNGSLLVVFCTKSESRITVAIEIFGFQSHFTELGQSLILF